MRFEADKNDLHKAVATVEGIIPAREIRSVISNVLIETKGEQATMTATDLELAIRTSFSVASGKDGRITLPARTLGKGIRELPAGKVVVESDTSGQTHVRAAAQTRGGYDFMGAPADEFPSIPSIASDSFHSLPSSVLLEMIRKTTYAIAEEDARYVFNGLYLINKGKSVTIVATDGRRLSRITREFPGELPFKQGVIIPGKAVRELQKLLGGAENASVAFDEKDRRLHFRVDQVDMICKLIDGQFPDYEQVIPQKIDKKLTLDRSAFEQAVRMAAVMAGEPSKQVRLTFSSGTVMFTAQTPDVGNSSTPMECDYKGEEITIAFNSNYLLDVTRVLDASELLLGFSSANSPSVLMEAADPQFVAVIMPMKF